MPFAQLENARIHYELAGPASAPTLVLSNSLGSTLSMWDSQISSFQQQFRVLRYDTRGHGQSSVPTGPYSVEQLAHDVLSLLDALDLDRVHFCGLSMGGSTGMWLALHAPNRLRKLVLCNTAAKIGTSDGWNTRIETVRKSGMKSISAPVLERWLTPAYRAKFPDVAATTQRMLESTNPDGYAANCAAIRDFDVRASIEAVTLPTLIISGAHDSATTTTDGHFLASHIPAACYVELNASHLSNIEASDRFTSEVSSFLLS